MAEHGGRMIFISSVGGINPAAAIGAYDVTKAGIIHLAKVLAARARPRCDGQLHRAGPGPDRLRTHAVGATRRSREGAAQPDDIAAAAVYLAGPGGTRVSGTTLVVDAGGLVSGTLV